MKLVKPVVGLAPMDGVTDVIFRSMVTSIAKPDLLFTEFVSAEGLTRGGVKLYDQLLFLPDQQPIIGQLFGKDPDSFYKATVVLAHLGFAGIDLNMGCPARTVTNHGSGAALIDQPKLASQLIKSSQKAILDFSHKKVSLKDIGLNQKTQKIIARNIKFSASRPNFKPTLSVKTRLGTSQFDLNWFKFLSQFDLDFITVHARTTNQAYSGVADWSKIKKIKTIIDIPLFGNGDLQTRTQALDYIDKYHLNGALIGRAALGNPWLFNDQIATNQQRFSAILLHAQTHQHIFPKKRFEPLRKHFLAYTKTLPNAKKLRAFLTRATNLSDLLALETHFQD